MFKTRGFIKFLLFATFFCCFLTNVNAKNVKNKDSKAIVRLKKEIKHKEKNSLYGFWLGFNKIYNDSIVVLASYFIRDKIIGSYPANFYYTPCTITEKYSCCYVPFCLEKEGCDADLMNIIEERIFKRDLNKNIKIALKKQLDENIKINEQIIEANKLCLINVLKSKIKNMDKDSYKLKKYKKMLAELKENNINEQVLRCLKDGVKYWSKKFTYYSHIEFKNKF